MKVDDIDLATHLKLKGVPIKSFWSKGYGSDKVYEFDFDIDEEKGREMMLEFYNSEVCNFMRARIGLIRMLQQSRGRDYAREIQGEIRDSKSNRPIGSK